MPYSGHLEKLQNYAESKNEKERMNLEGQKERTEVVILVYKAAPYPLRLGPWSWAAADSCRPQELRLPPPTGILTHRWLTRTQSPQVFLFSVFCFVFVVLGLNSELPVC